MGIGDDLNDLSDLNNNNNPYQHPSPAIMRNIPVVINVSEGPGTGIDGGGGVIYHSGVTEDRLQDGQHVEIIEGSAEISPGYVSGGIFDCWEDKIVDVSYNVFGKEVHHRVHIGNNTSDSVMQYIIYPFNPQDAPDVIPEDNVSVPDYTCNDFYNDFRNQGDLPWVGSPLDWGDAIYNGVNNTLGGGWIGGFVGGVAEGLIGGAGMAIAGTGFAISKSVGTGSIDPLKWWGSTMIDGIVDTVLTPYRAYEGEDITARDWGNFASIFVGIKGSKVGWKGISKTGDYIRTRNLPKLPAESYIHPEAMDASKPTFPAAKNFNELKQSFEDAGNKVITFTPDEIVGNVVGDSRKGSLGMEDSGIYVAPKGSGNPYFTRKADSSFSWREIYEEAKKGISIKWNPIDNLKDKWNKYGKTGRVYETQVNKVVEPPKEVLEQPGFSGVNEWGQKNLVGTGNIRFTKRSMIGQGVVKRQKYKNPETGKWDWEHGTVEYEAVIDKGYKFVDEGPTGWIQYGDRRIIVNEFSLLDKDGRKIGTGLMDENGRIVEPSKMGYDEFVGKIKEDAKPYYDNKYEINLDSSIHYIKPNEIQEYGKEYRTNTNEYNPSKKYGNTMDDYNNYIKDSYDDHLNKYDKNYQQSENYHNYNNNYKNQDYTDTNSADYGKTTHGDYSNYPTGYPPSPPAPPTPPITHLTITLPPAYLSKITYEMPTVYSPNEKKKKKKRDNTGELIKTPKNFKQGVAKSKRNWYVKNIEKAFSDMEKQVKELMRF
jgi:hypothetical protein